MRNWVKLNFEEHSNSRWRQRNRYHFTREMTDVEILVSELKVLFSDYVVAFTKKGDEMTLVVLLSLWNNRNFYVNSENKWLSNYTPAALRGHPFSIKQDSSSSTTYSLYIDSAHISENENDKVIYDDEGNYELEVMGFVNFLGQRERDFNLTKRACDSLNEFGLIKPWELKINTEDGPQLLENLYCIDEVALSSVSADILKKIRDDSGLIVAYAQLFSISRISQLTKRAELIAREDQRLGVSQIEDYLFSDDAGSLNFDNLDIK